MFAWKWLYRLIYISLYSFLNLVSLNFKNTAQIVYIAQNEWAVGPCCDAIAEKWKQSKSIQMNFG